MQPKMRWHHARIKPHINRERTHDLSHVPSPRCVVAELRAGSDSVAGYGNRERGRIGASDAERTIVNGAAIAPGRNADDVDGRTRGRNRATESAALAKRNTESDSYCGKESVKSAEDQSVQRS